jgi:hypothetical protein
VLEFTDKLVGLLTMRNPLKRAVRDTVLPLVTRLPAVQRGAARHVDVRIRALIEQEGGQLEVRIHDRDGQRRRPLTARLVDVRSSRKECAHDVEAAAADREQEWREPPDAEPRFERMGPREGLLPVAPRRLPDGSHSPGRGARRPIAHVADCVRQLAGEIVRTPSAGVHRDHPAQNATSRGRRSVSWRPSAECRCESDAHRLAEYHASR